MGWHFPHRVGSRAINPRTGEYDLTRGCDYAVFPEDLIQKATARLNDVPF